MGRESLIQYRCGTIFGHRVVESTRVAPIGVHLYQESGQIGPSLCVGWIPFS